MIVLIILIGTLICLNIYQYTSKKEILKENDLIWRKEVEIQRAQAIKQSKSVTRGQITEHMLPMFPDFPYLMSECKFSGAPIDYLVFKGMDNVREGVLNAQISIIFADVKVGSAQRTKVQNAIKKAIQEGRVSFETWKVQDNIISISI